MKACFREDSGDATIVKRVSGCWTRAVNLLKCSAIEGRSPVSALVLLLRYRLIRVGLLESVT